MNHFYFELIVCFILSALFIGLTVNFFVKKILNEYLDKINKTLENLNLDLDMKLIYKLPALIKFYDGIFKLQKILKAKEKKHNEIIKVLNSVAINIELNKFLEDFIPKISAITESSAAAFYVLNDFNNKLEIKYSMGFNKNIYKEFDLEANEFVTDDFEMKIVKNIPGDSIFMVKSFLGKVKPKSLLIVPVETENKLNGILILVSIYDYTNEQIEIIKAVKNYIGIAIKNGISFERTERLINELKLQNKLIQDLNDTLEKKIKI